MSREPSMEEILSSIRRVIARDESAQQAATPRPLSPMREALPEDEDDDVLELTEQEPALSSVSPETEDDSITMPAPASTATNTAGAAELISPLSAAASRSSLDVLAAVLASGKSEEAPSLPNGDTSVNALVEAALRPMLKQWLDAHLPAIVERLVASEIARITGTRS